MNYTASWNIIGITGNILCHSTLVYGAAVEDQGVIVCEGGGVNLDVRQLIHLDQGFSVQVAEPGLGHPQPVVAQNDGSAHVLRPIPSVGVLQLVHSGARQDVLRLAGVQMVEEGVLGIIHLCPCGQAEQKHVGAAGDEGEVPVPCVLPLLVPCAVVAGEKDQLALVQEPPELPLVVDIPKGYVNLTGLHIHLYRDQLIVPGLPELGVHQGLPVLAPGQVIEQAAGIAILVTVHFDILGLYQFPNLRLADIGALRGNVAAGQMLPLLHVEEGQHRHAQLRAGGKGGGNQAGDGQGRGQNSGKDPAG